MTCACQKRENKSNKGNGQCVAVTRKKGGKKDIGGPGGKRCMRKAPGINSLQGGYYICSEGYEGDTDQESETIQTNMKCM